jgi:hypothetical protein
MRMKSHVAFFWLRTRIGFADDGVRSSLKPE